jgi:hypothetical protein
VVDGGRDGGGHAGPIDAPVQRCGIGLTCPHFACQSARLPLILPPSEIPKSLDNCLDVMYLDIKVTGK